MKRSPGASLTEDAPEVHDQFGCVDRGTPGFRLRHGRLISRSVVDGFLAQSRSFKEDHSISFRD